MTQALAKVWLLNSSFPYHIYSSLNLYTPRLTIQHKSQVSTIWNHPPDIWRNGTFRLWTARRHYFTISVPSHSILSKKFTSAQWATALLILSETHHAVGLCAVSVTANASALFSPAYTCDPNSCLLSCVTQTLNQVPLQIGLPPPEHKLQN